MQTREKTLRVEGLDCADCARRLEEGICRLDGIQECSLSYTTGRLYLRYNGTLDQVRELAAAYGYSLRESDEEDRGEAVARQRVMQAAIAAAVLLAAALTARFSGTVSAIFLFLTIVIGGRTTFARAWAALRRRQLDMNVLMTVAVCGALLLREWWEGAVVAFLFAAGNALETYTAEKNRRALRSMMQDVPDVAHRLQDGLPEDVPVKAVAAGDLILVRPGEYIPLDGTVVGGSSQVNEAAVTGESLPVGKEEGSRVFAGSLNGAGSLTVRVSGTWQDSTLARIMRLVEEAREKRVPVQQFIDRFARVYTPAAMLLAVLYPLAGILAAGGGLKAWLYRGLALLLVACPCSLVLAAPLPVVAALTSAARRGILIKGGVFLEAVGQVKALLFDKTGTLTKGRPEVTAVHTFSRLAEREIIGLAASLEAHSEHVLAEAVRARADALGAEVLPVSDFSAVPGRGVAGIVAGTRYYLGSPAFLAERGIKTEILQQCGRNGETIIALATEKEVLGAVLLADTVREESAAAVHSLRTLGVEHISMLTGDRRQSAAALAERLQLDSFAAELLPEEKAAALQQELQQWGKVAMVGDGINDAPALALSTVGIAMGAAGSPAALETADIALLNDNLASLPYLLRLSRKTAAAIRQNITLSLLLKLLAILLVLSGRLTLWLAITADMGASLLVTLNSMRLLSYRS
ncbi:MAG: cation-translocating P-type ATPase [Firmicutes bacterium]|nr:cation-translocating P-type ATPase [Bacillota bacterium]